MSNSFKDLYPKLQPWLWRVLIALAAVGVYQPSLRGDFLWDDIRYIYQNQSIMSPQGLLTIWTQFQENVNFWPVSNSLFWLQYQLWGSNPLGFRIFNLCLHIFNCWLLLKLLTQLGLKRAGWVTLAFGVHPLVVESVAWISELKNLASFFLSCTCLIFFQAWLKKPQKMYYAAAIFFCGAALLAKSATVFLPFALFLMLIWERPQWRIKELKCLLPFFLLMVTSLLLFYYEESFKQSLVSFQYTLWWPERIMIALQAYFFYWQKSLWPYPLMSIYPLIKAKLWSKETLILLAELMVSGSLLWSCWRKHRRAAILLFIYSILAVAPVLGLVLHLMSDKSNVADHYFYFSLPAVLTLIVLGLEQGFQVLQSTSLATSPRFHKYRPLLELLSLSALLLVWGLIARGQSQTHQSNLTLSEHNALYNQESGFVQFLLGTAYFDRQHYHEAIHFYTRAIELNPRDESSINNRAACYEKLGQDELAYRDYSASLKLNPRFDASLHNRARYYWRKGRYSEALADLKLCLEIKPTFHEARWLEAKIKFQLNDFAGALASLVQLENSPRNGDDVLLLKGQALLKLEKFEEALLSLAESVRLQPQQIQAYLEIARIYLQHGQFPEALSVIEQGLKNNPQHPRLLIFRGQLYFDLKQNSQSCEDWSLACKMGICDAWNTALQSQQCQEK